MNTNQNEVQFFDLHATGIGYLNRFRKVTPNQGQPYYCVTVALLRGNRDSPQYTYVDCNIVSDDALNLLLNLLDPKDDNAKYLAQVRIGDLYAEPFIYQSGNKEGQPGVSMKGRLLKIFSLRKNGDTIYQQQKTPSVVKVPVSAPDFLTRKADLESRGYVWNEAQQQFERQAA